MNISKISPAFLRYLVESEVPPGERLPTLYEIGTELGISVGKLREQLEVARHLGLVTVRPRVGIIRERFSFQTAVLSSILIGLSTGEAQFEQYSRLRQGIETAFWHDAVTHLTEADLQLLHDLVSQAWEKLRGQPIHVPNGEHRQLHLTMFSRLENPVVQGLLAAYWDAYEASELTRYASYQYWLDVWSYHERIVNALCRQQFDLGQQLLTEHFSLLPSGTQAPEAD